MGKSELRHLYFEWMCRLVCDDRYADSRRSSYHSLLRFLHDTPFRYEDKPEMDENRAMDGIDLRYRFGYENNIPYPQIAAEIDDMPCSFLEMLIALAFRCDDIMDDRACGDRLSEWFWTMLNSLGLAKMNDARFDKTEAINIINRFARNNYDPDGHGGLFTIKNCKEDLRRKEILWQMYRYLDVYYQDEW